jgi:hypothetical protein
MSSNVDWKKADKAGARLRGGATRGEPLVGKIPHGHWKTTTVGPAIHSAYRSLRHRRPDCLPHLGRTSPGAEPSDADPHWEWAKAPDVRDIVRPVIAEMRSFLKPASRSPH